MRGRTSRPPGLERDGGFTLVEAVVALAILALVSAAVAVEVVQALRHTVIARQNEQAADLLMEQVEQARSTAYGALAMSSSDLALAADPRLSVSGTTYADIGLAQPEPVYATSTGSVNPHRLPASATVRGGTRYAVDRYVTTPTATVPTSPVTTEPCRCRRYTVFVTWSAYGQTHTRSTSTVVADVVRGRTPVWSWAPTQGRSTSVNLNNGSSTSLPGEVVNRGVRDTWTLTAMLPAGWTVRWYRDDNGDGVRQGTETTLLDNEEPGVGTTPVVLPDRLFDAVALVSWPSGTSGTFTVTLKARAGLDATTTRTIVYQVTR